MFTGLVESAVPLLESVVVGPGKRMCFDLGPIADGVEIGDSIALNGCCLTVIALEGTKCWFELGAET
ncbi:MAG TPA: riboflavin synthase, partial [Pirellula sp.]|nr:riboflavin synthase [Pirellula sp.]